MPTKMEIVLEAERRGILPAKDAAILAEARKRGLAPGPVDVPPIPEVQKGPDLTPSVAEQIVGSGLQGGTFNTSDELVAAARSRLPGMRSYEEELELERGRLRQTPPEIAIPAQVGGAIGSLGYTVPLAVGTGVANMLGRMGPVAAGTISGLMSGLFSGFGSGEGGPVSRMGSAAVGGGLGAATGGLMPLLGRGVRKGAEALSGGRLAAGGVAPPPPVVPKPQRRAAEELTGALQKDILPRVATPAEQASLSPSQLAQRVTSRAAAREAALGPQATLLDVGGLNTRGVVRAAAGQQGMAKEFVERELTKRGAGQQQRVIDAARSALGTTKRYGDTLDEVIEARAAAARPLYQAALDAEPQGGLQSEAIDRLTQNATVRGLINKVKGESLQLDNLPDNSLRVLDEVYKELGSNAANLRSRANPQRSGTAAHRMDELRVALREAIVDQVPKYGEALETFSHDSNLLDALISGRNVLRQEDYMTRKTVEKLSEGEKEMWLVGVAEGIQDIVERVQNPRDVTKKILGNKQVQQRLKAAIPDNKAWRTFQRELLREAEFAQASQGARPTVGSQTALRAEEISDLIDPIRQVIRTATVFGAVPAAAQGGGRLLTKYFRGKGQDEMNEAIGRLALSPMSEGQRILQEANALALAKQVAAQRAGAAGSVAGIGAGAMTGPAVSGSPFVQELNKLTGMR